MEKHTIEEIKEHIKWVEKNPDGTACLRMGVLPDGRGLFLVIGWEEGYDLGDGEYQKENEGKIYTICSKLAVNIDDLQCSYNFDWYMPWNKETGDIWDTEMSVSDDFNLEWYEEQAEEIIKAFKNGELEV